MPPILRYRLALIGLVGILLIPVGVSSLGGLTHVLTCREEVRTPFSFEVAGGQRPSLASSLDVAAGQSLRQCGVLTVNLRAGVDDVDRVVMVVPITNHSEHLWHGTVLLVLDDTTIPVGVESIPGGATRSDTVSLRLDPGLHEVTGSLLIGP